MMKSLTHIPVLICFSIVGITSSQAGDSVTVTPTEFATPAEYCFPQTVVKSKESKFNDIALDHHLIIQKTDHFKIGDTFVGFRQKSQPGILWLTDGVSWFNANEDPDKPKAYPVSLPNNNDSKLQPIIPITLSNELIDVSAYVDDGEVLVGYGLRSEGESWQKSYDDMIKNQRFQLIWEIGGPTPSHGIAGVQPIICLTTTGMKEIVMTATTQDK